MRHGQIMAMILPSLAVLVIGSTLSSNTFYLLCYKKDDLRCQEAEREVNTGYNMLINDPKYQNIPKHAIPRIEIVDCLAGQNRERCKNELGHNNHELMPPRLKIVPPDNNNKVYMFTSPIKAEFVLRKLMKFTVPVTVIPL
jgi:hypothetical protein